jgi:hypothetical protein
VRSSVKRLRQRPDANAPLVRFTLVATWEVAFIEAHRIFHQSRDIERANTAFLAIVDQGTRGLKAAEEGSPLYMRTCD